MADLLGAIVPGTARNALFLALIGMFLLGAGMWLGWFCSRSRGVLDQEGMEWKRFFTLSPEMLCVAGTDGFFKQVNPAFHHVLGYSVEELLARPILDFVHPEDTIATQKEFEKLEEGVPTIQFENRYRCKNGTIRWFSWKCHPVQGEGIFYATARDVTGRRQIAKEMEQLNSNLNKRAAQLEAANEEMQASNRFLDSVIENIPDMIFVKDAMHLRFVRFNRAGEELLGYSRAELIGKNDFDLFPKEEADAFTHEDRNVLVEGVVHSIPEEPIMTRHKGERLLRTKKLPILDDQGQPKYLLGISEDVTEQKDRERQIFKLSAMIEQRAAEVEVANSELESFSYSVSHDLRAPLRHVQGYVHMLRQEMGGTLSVKASHCLKTITDASVEMGQLIDDLLAFSRMGRTEMQTATISLKTLLREARAVLEPLMKERNIVWKIGKLPVVQGDPSMLKQVLVNLVGNALKYSRFRDPAEIEIGTDGEEHGRLILFVRDNGAGFDMRYAHKLFGVFQRLHRADEFEGTGIGLAIVKRVIARHGGRVWCEGEMDRGATFYFTLMPETAS